MSSIFLDEKVYQYAASSLNNIVISDTSKKSRIEPINGLLQEPLQFSVEADYDNIFSLNERFNSAKTLLGTAGLGLFNAGMWTKKFYKGGSYLKINPKIRVTDWNGNGQTLVAASSLIDMCLPIYNGSLDIKTKELLRKAVEKVQKEGVFKATADGIFAALKATGGEIADILSGEEGDKILNLLSGKEILSNSPSPVNVKISNFYENSFVIDSVQVEFSREMTDLGPLYVDINLSLSTPTVSTRGNSGLLTSIRQPRYTNTD